MTRTLYFVACAAPPARRLPIGIRAAQKAGWDVCLVLTPSAHRWNADAIEDLRDLTGHPVRHAYKHPDEPDVLPAPDAILVAPATFNALNKWVPGISDTLALGLVTEAIGLELPLVALPYLNRAQAAHPALDQSVRFLRDNGGTVPLGDEGCVPHEPKHGNLDAYPWQTALNTLP
ncbi:flavoprotein [Streptomyces sp. 184]|uniref:flavoprotein n=1 Tax=Streptomyces sp. 184 TaxID=1827526 RepID=UPI00389262D4